PCGGVRIETDEDFSVLLVRRIPSNGPGSRWRDGVPGLEVEDAAVTGAGETIVGHLATGEHAVEVCAVVGGDVDVSLPAGHGHFHVVGEEATHRRIRYLA